ncbi:hypothetical protein ACS386_04150 [Flavobacteriaceae bacterium LMO-SS05]
MKRLILVCYLLVFVSCNYFEKKKVYSEDILEEELQTFNWNDVDEYPTFASCDHTSGKENKRQCFENTVLQLLNNNFAKQNIVVTEDVNDTILLKITINNLGQFSINDMVYSELTKSQIPNIDSLLIHSFDSLPKIYPAIKRSQQVTTQFSLPVVVRINDITN